MKSRMLGVFSGILLVIFLVAGREAPASTPTEPYKVAISSAMTGPLSGEYHQQAEGIRIYFKRLNDSGGINGREVKFTIKDNGNDATKTAVSYKELLTQKPDILVHFGLSPTQPAALKAAQDSGLPEIVFAGTVREAASPNPHPLIFATWGGSSGIDTYAPAPQILSKFVEPVPKNVVGLLTIEAGAAIVANNLHAAYFEKAGYSTSKMVVPVSSTDLTPAAKKFVDEGVVAMMASGTAEFSIILHSSLRKLGWKGWYIFHDGSCDFGKYSERFAGEPVIMIENNSVPFVEALSEHEEVKEAAKKYGATLAGSLLTGWHMGRIIENVFREAGWPATPDKLLKVLNHFELSDPLTTTKWTETDHLGPSFAIIYLWNKKVQKWERDSVWRVGYIKGTAEVESKEIPAWWKRPSPK